MTASAVGESESFVDAEALYAQAVERRVTRKDPQQQRMRETAVDSTFRSSNANGLAWPSYMRRSVRNFLDHNSVQITGSQSRS